MDHMGIPKRQALSRGGNMSILTDKQGWVALKSPTVNSGEYKLDVGLPSVCCEYISLLLVNKEAALAYSRTE